MDDDAAIGYLAELGEFLELSLIQYNRNRDLYFQDPEYVATNHAIEQRLVGARHIAQRAEPDLDGGFVRAASMYGWEWSEVREATNKLVGFLQRREQLERILEPKGPKLAAESLHPWVWEAAARMWDDGHRRGALQAAATAVEQQLQAKLNRLDISGDALVTSAFKIDPPRAGEPRLRFRGVAQGSQEYTNMHEGAMYFAKGCVRAIRNIASHNTDEPDEQISLEYLAAMSVLARWIDAAEVVTAT